MRAQLIDLARQIGQSALSDASGVSQQTLSRWINEGIPAKSYDRAQSVIGAASKEIFPITPELLEKIGRALMTGEPMPAVRFAESIESLRARVENFYIPQGDANTGQGAQLAGDDFYRAIAPDASSRGQSDFDMAMAELVRAILRDLGLEHKVFDSKHPLDLSQFADSDQRRQGEFSARNPMKLWQMIDYIRGAGGARPLPQFFGVYFAPDGSVVIIDLYTQETYGKPSDDEDEPELNGDDWTFEEEDE